MSKYTIQEVNVSQVNTGKKPYHVANVVYSNDRGENKTKKIMDFSNPAVFAALKDITSPTTVEVELDGAPYYNWKAISVLNTAAATSPAVKAKSSFETPEERAKKQIMIVRQSCLAQAVSSLGAGLELNTYLERADEFVNWVLNFEDGFAETEG